MKKSFTLIEILISITILSLIVASISQIILSVKSSKNSLERIYKSFNKKNIINKIIYYDIMNASSIKIFNKNKNYSIIKIRTQNSLYNIPYPYVIYYVSKNNNTLIRLSTPKEVFLPVFNDFKNFYILKLANNIKIFKIYNNKDKIFIYFQQKNHKPIYFEFRRIK